MRRKYTRRTVYRVHESQMGDYMGWIAEKDTKAEANEAMRKARLAAAGSNGMITYRVMPETIKELVS